jgi:low affinity Fe/Cu permease
MSHDAGSVVEPIRQVVRKAHDDFQALQTAVGRASMLMPLLVAGIALDKLLMTLDLLASSTSNFNNDLLYSVFDACVGTDIQLSHAIMRDVTAVAERLRLMTPTTSKDPMVTMEEHECQKIADMIDRYDKAISSVLVHHNSYVRSLSSISILYSCSVDLLWTHSCLKPMPCWME